MVLIGLIPTRGWFRSKVKNPTPSAALKGRLGRKKRDNGGAPSGLISCTAAFELAERFLEHCRPQRRHLNRGCCLGSFSDFNQLVPPGGSAMPLASSVSSLSLRALTVLVLFLSVCGGALPAFAQDVLTYHNSNAR